MGHTAWRPALAGLSGLLAVGVLAIPLYPVVAEATGSFVPSWPVPSVGSSTPTPVPSPSVQPFGDPESVAELLARIPAPLREACLPEVPLAGPQPGERARLICLADDGGAPDPIESSWALFDMQHDLDAAFDQAVSWASVFGHMGPGTDCAGGAYLGSWSVDAREVGRLLCFGAEGIARITWTDATARILATIRVPGEDHARAWAHWLRVRSTT